MSPELSTNRKGAIAEAAIAAEATKLGVEVLRPMAEHGRYDLAFDFGSRILRVQCKWASLSGDVITIRLETRRYNARGVQIVSTYSSSEVDLIAGYCLRLNRVFVLPIEEVAGQGAVFLRLRPSRNGQLAGVRMADDYRLGAVAQLAERRAGSAKARGSNPLSSTRDPAGFTDPVITAVPVGAHEFRNRFGWYMQQAAAGEIFHVTRRGKPHVTLGPPRS